jgi:hypothetical protein
MSAIDTTLSPDAGFHSTFTSSISSSGTSTGDALAQCTFFLVHQLPPSFIVDRFQLDELNHDVRLFVTVPSADDSYDSTLKDRLSTSPRDGNRDEDPEVSVHVHAVRDLEKPVGAILLDYPQLSIVIVKVTRWSGSVPAVVQIPVHLRYQDPIDEEEGGVSDDHGQRKEDSAVVVVKVHEPVAFWSCPKGKEGRSFSCGDILLMLPFSSRRRECGHVFSM